MDGLLAMSRAPNSAVDEACQQVMTDALHDLPPLATLERKVSHDVLYDPYGLGHGDVMFNPVVIYGNAIHNIVVRLLWHVV